MVNGYTSSSAQGCGFRGLKDKVLDLAWDPTHACSISPRDPISVKDNTKITVEGADKEVVGQVPKIWFLPAEPYKGKGVHIVGKCPP